MIIKKFDSPPGAQVGIQFKSLQDNTLDTAAQHLHDKGVPSIPAFFYIGRDTV
jgi:hypothetical protein